MLSCTRTVRTVLYCTVSVLSSTSTKYCTVPVPVLYQWDFFIFCKIQVVDQYYNIDNDLFGGDVEEI